MTILYFCLAWFLGIIAAAYLLAPPVIIVVFGIPFTYEMRRKGILTSVAPAARYAVWFFLLLGLFGLVTWGVWYLLPRFIWVYVLVAALTLVRGLRKCTRNDANMTDFFDRNADYVNEDAFFEWMSAKESSGEL